MHDQKETRKRRPEFISREEFRSYMTPSRLNKLFAVDGMLPGSLLNRWEREGQPLRSMGGRYRPLDVIAKAWAKGMTIERERAEKVRFDLEQAREELEDLEGRVGAKRHQIAMDEISSSLSSKVLLTEEEIVAGKQSYVKNSGVYFLIKGQRVVYVGQSVNVYARVASHAPTKDFDSFTYIPLPVYQLDAAESLYIHALKPEQNGRSGGDGRISAPMTIEDLIAFASKARMEASNAVTNDA